MFDLKTKIALFGIFASLSFMWWAIIHKSNTKVDPNIIYSQLSNDNWGTSTARDTIDEEYRVVLTKDSLTITELVPGSIFFKNFVKDSTLNTITVSFERAKFKSNEYWANVAEASERFTLFHYNEVYCIFVQGHSGMIRLVFRAVDDGVRDEYFYFWPSKENK